MNARIMKKARGIARHYLNNGFPLFILEKYIPNGFDVSGGGFGIVIFYCNKAILRVDNNGGIHYFRNIKF